MTITPFNVDGDLDERRFRAHLQFMAEAELGVYVASQGSGEGDLLTAGEKVQLFAIAASELQGRRAVVAAGIGLAGSTASACALARAADEAGVDAVQLLGPRPGPLRPRDAEIEQYLSALVGEVRCDVHLSSNAVLTGYELPFEVVERLVEKYRRITVLNVTAGADAMLPYVARAVEIFGERLDVRVGMTAEVVNAHAVGARGLLCFEPNIAPHVTVNAGRTLEVDPLLRLNQALARGGNPRSLKAALAIIGHECGPPRLPYLPLPDDEVRTLRDELRALELPGVTP
jgi:4-hydroxy-tetrahydrodipicolinate synthase